MKAKQYENKLGVRQSLTQTANTRAKIQTTQILKRLTNHIFGKLELSTSQVRAAEVLLKKTLPDLSAVEMDSNIHERKVISAEPMDLEEWEDKYGNKKPEDASEAH